MCVRAHAHARVSRRNKVAIFSLGFSPPYAPTCLPPADCLPKLLPWCLQSDKQTNERNSL